MSVNYKYLTFYSLGINELNLTPSEAYEKKDVGFFRSQTRGY